MTLHGERQAKLGKDFRLKAFRGCFLSNNGMPVRNMRELMAKRK